MKSIFTAFLFSTLALSGTAAFAGEQTVKLSVPGMSCASCPYMVEKAISSVNGIKAVDATMEDRSATVVFDDAVTSVVEIQQATAGIGYESTPIVSENAS